MEIDEIKKLVSNVEGWLDDKEGELLYSLAKRCAGKGVIVEIGSFKGKSTIWLGKGSKSGKKVRIYAIDPHTGGSWYKRMRRHVWSLDDFEKNIRNAEVDDIIIPIVKTSEEAAQRFDHPIELIFIDGLHEYEHVKKDFTLWYPKVIDGGIMVFHDTVGWPGPKKLVEEFLYKSKNFRNVRFVKSVTFAEKVKRNSVGDRLSNLKMLLLKRLYEHLTTHSYVLLRKSCLLGPVRVVGEKLVGLVCNDR